MSEPLPEKVPKPPIPKGQGKGLTKKIGPLPAWAWGAIVVGGIAFFLYVRSKTGKTTTADAGGTPASGTIFDQGGGPPSSPANGVTDGTNPCPPGYDFIGGACVPTSGSVGGTAPPDTGPGLYGPPIGSVPFIITPLPPTASSPRVATPVSPNLENERNALKKAAVAPKLKKAVPAGHHA